MLERFLLGPWRRIAEEAERERPRGLDLRVPGALILLALILVAEEYVGDRDFFAAHFDRWAAHPDYELMSYAWWSGAKLVGYALVPLLAMRLARVPWSVAHLSFAGLRQHLGAYGLLYLVVLPCVVLASRTQAFQSTYPFYREAQRSWRDLVAWELLYAATFVALELLFRGFLLGLLRRSLGPYAIFVMLVPYTMIHFGKPAAEAVGAIFAGVALGTLAMATRSIWGGVLIHVAIAWTMDLAALLQRR